MCTEGRQVAPMEALANLKVAKVAARGHEWVEIGPLTRAQHELLLAREAVWKCAEVAFAKELSEYW